MNEEWSQHAASQIAHWAEMSKAAIGEAAAEYMRPSVANRPKLSIDGNQWCALYGDNLQDGVAGFGESPADAMWDFDRNWGKPLQEFWDAHVCAQDIAKHLPPVSKAQELSDRLIGSPTVYAEAATELRRLEALVEGLAKAEAKQHWKYNELKVLHEDRGVLIRLIQQQRDELLEALKRVHMNCAQPSLWLSAVNDALKKHGGQG